MIILTIIDGIPLFKDIERAILWGKQFGLTGYHAHTFDNQVGYMGGASHIQATGMPANSNAPTGGGGGGGY